MSEVPLYIEVIFPHLKRGCSDMPPPVGVSGLGFRVQV